MAISQDTLNQVQDLYLAFLDRPEDQGGLNYWANVLTNNGGNIQSVIPGFVNSTEYQNLYGNANSSDTSTTINQIYQNLFNRPADDGGLQYWANVYNTNHLTPGELAYDILQGGIGANNNTDTPTIENKIQAANVFTNTVQNYSDSTMPIARDFINHISANTNVSSITPTTIMQPILETVYLAFLDRPADQGGLQYWANVLVANGGNVQSIMPSFANSTEAQNLYSTTTPSDVGTVVNQIYQNLFNRPADDGGLQYWTNVYNTNHLTPGELAYDILQGGIGANNNTDTPAIENKIQAANVITNTVQNFSGTTLSTIRDFINHISADIDVSSITPTTIESLINNPSSSSSTTTTTSSISTSPSAVKSQLKLIHLGH